MARHTRKGPVRLTARIRSHWSRGISTVLKKPPMPATLHTTVGSPRSAASAATVSPTEASEVTSQR